MGEYAVTCYYNTGFDHGNVPSSPTVLAAAQQKEFNGIFKFQVMGLGSVRLDTTYDDIADVDYCRVDNTYYVVDMITMLNAHTAELALSMDPITTMGGVGAITFIGGWESRAHVTDDTLFSNNIPEPFTPARPLVVVDSPEEVHKMQDGADTTNFVGSTTDLNGLVDYQATVLSAAEGGSVTIPTVPALPASRYTKVFMIHGKAFTLPGVAIYKQDDVTSFINIARQLGIEGVITAAYTIPTNDFSATYQDTAPVKAIAQINGNRTVHTSNSPYAYGAVKNNKALALYNTYTMVSTSSGSSETFDAHDIQATSAETAPVFETLVDPSPNGTVYMKPVNFQGAEAKKLSHSISGMPWMNSGVVMEGASGSTLATVNAGRKNYIVDYDRKIANTRTEFSQKREEITVASGTAQDTIGLVLGNIGKAPGMINRGIEYGLNTAQREMETAQRNERTSWVMGDNIFNNQVQTGVIAPEINYPVSINMSAYFGNSFMLYHIGLDATDLARFDRFLTMYGYAVDRPFAVSDLTNRVHFNYIKASDVQVKNSSGNSGPMYVCRMVRDMLANGVRLWHELPNQAAYSDNPIVQ